MPGRLEPEPLHSSAVEDCMSELLGEASLPSAGVCSLDLSLEALLDSSPYQSVAQTDFLGAPAEAKNGAEVTAALAEAAAGEGAWAVREISEGDRATEGADAGPEPVSAGLGLRALNGQLHSATLAGDPELVCRLLDLGAMVNAPVHSGNSVGDIFITLLHVIACRTDLPRGTEILAELVRRKANLNARSSLGSTPLAWACLHKHLAAAEKLLEYGADHKPMDDGGRTALICAVSLETNPADVTKETAVSAGLVALLASRNADLDGGEAPPLLGALRNNNRPAVAALVEHGAKPKYLHTAVEQATVGIIEDLLKAQANPFEEDREGKSVLDVAFRRGDEEITTLLRDCIGDLERLNVNNASGESGAAFKCRISMAASSASSDRAGGEVPDDDMALGLSTDVRQRDSTGSASTKAKRLFPRKFSFTSSGINLGQPRRKFQARARESGDFSKANYEWKAFREWFSKFQKSCRSLTRNRNFQLLMFMALLAVLFFPDLWVICDVEGNNDLDIILIVMLLLFITELVLQSIGTPKAYINSFFFWMDIVGMLSVPLDHSMVSENFPQNLDNAVVMRAARSARLGTRAGRFTKLVKLLRFLPGVQQQQDDNPQDSGTAKTMSNALMTSLSTRVSCLIIVMVMVLPLFDMATYPENDYSMKTWMNSLEFTLGRHGPQALERRLADFEAFYNNKEYYPFEVVWDKNGTSSSARLMGRRPRRLRNELEIKADSGSVTVMFNFGPQNRVDALCNMVLIVVIILLMMGFSMLLSNSVSNIVLRPLENMLTGVQQMSCKIFKSVTHLTAKSTKEEREKLDGREDHSAAFGNETELLERVIDKLATLSAITMKTTPIDAETFNKLGETDRAVLQGFSPEQLPRIQIRALESTASHDSVEQGKREDHMDELVRVLEAHLEEAGLAWNLVDSWEFNVLDIEEQQRQLACLCFMIFHLGLGYRGKQQGFLIAFIEVVATGYSNPNKVPYHNWYHAVDVTHCIFRLLNRCSTERFLSNVERFALIISALCHDIGHTGFNNPFLVETSHELAIRYNDLSPLENMHCARLFEIVSQSKTAVFGSLDKQQYKEARQVCIAAILHTDNIHHFAMVKEMQMLYEMNSDVFDIALQMYQVGQVDFPPREVCDILGEPENKKSVRNLLLHFSDISNPMKPFHICKRWAWNIIDEFFMQGDKEKELGITVQPLNDREKVNRPYSQVGFIEFFVAPFAFATVRVLPPLVILTDQMMQNLNFWCEEWSTTTSPAPDQDDHLKLKERIAKLEAKFVFRDGF